MDISISIVDDSSVAIEKLVELLTSYFHSDNLSFYKYTDPLLINYQIESDIYFLDIDMPHKDGYHVAKEIYEKHPNAKIIFCTMHDDFVYKSFQFNPFYFIRKGHLEEDLKYAIKKLQNTFYNNSLILPYEHSQIKVSLSNTVYIESVRNYLIFHFFNDTSDLKIRYTIKKIEPYLNPNFIKITKGTIVNMAYIKHISKDTITLKNGIVLSMSRRLKNDISNQYTRFIMEE